MTDIQVKRIYDGPASRDGLRVLVDRLWPRGVRKADAAVDLWAKDLAPTGSLRKWFHHEPERWEEFVTRYRRELASRQDALDELRERARKGPVTLLYASRNRERNHAIVLRDVLLGH